MSVVSKEQKLVQNILFLDIETVSCAPSYEVLDDNFKELWDRKAALLGFEKPEEVAEGFFRKGGIYAEFGKIIVIGLGFMAFDEEDQPRLRTKAIYGHNEKELLLELKKIIEYFPQNSLMLCAHNGKEFDFPYLCRRMVIQGVPWPSVLDIAGKKPWEVSHIDTMEMWKFGDRKNFTSLHLLARLLGITSSKEWMKGNEVNHYYYVKKELESIARYCQEDVVVTAQIFLKLGFMPLMKPENIFRKD